MSWLVELFSTGNGMLDFLMDTDANEAIKGLAKTGYVAGGPKGWIKDFEGKLAASKVKTPE